MSKVHEVKHDDGTHYSWAFVCPACKSVHQCTSGWTFNGNVDAPTFSPSILVYGHAATPGAPIPVSERPRCHSFVTDGRIAYCTDSGHTLAGQTVELPEWDESKGLGGADG